MDALGHRPGAPGRQLDGRPRRARDRRCASPSASARSACSVRPSPSSGAATTRSCASLRPELGLLPHRFGARASSTRQSGPCSTTPTRSTPASPTSSSTSSSASTGRPSARFAFLASARNIYLDKPFGTHGFYPRLAELEPPGAVRLGLARSADPGRLPAPRRASGCPAPSRSCSRAAATCRRSSARSRPTAWSARFFARADALGARRCRGQRRSRLASRSHEPSTHGGHGVAATATRRDGSASDGRRRRASARAAPRLLARAGARGRRAPCSARIPAADLDERDPDYIRETLPRLWLLASLCFRGEVRGLGNIPEEGPVLLVGNHSGGNLTPGHRRLHARLLRLLRRRAALLPARPQPGAVDARARRSCASTAPSPPRPRTPRKALRVRRGGARLPRRRLRGPPAVAGSGNASTSTAARASSGSRSSRTCRSSRWSSIGGQETALFLSRGERLARRSARQAASA